MNKNLIVILGPTGIGKTDFSIYIAQKLNTCIISSDSRQIYKELKIGTAVPSDEQLKKVKHYFIANKSIYDYYNASQFEFEVIDLLNELFKTSNNVLMVGGSGMYIDAVCNGIDNLPTIDEEVRKNLLDRLENEGIDSLRTELHKIDPDYYLTADVKNPKRILKALEVFIMTGKPYSSFLTKNKKERDFNIIKIGLNIDRQKLYERINLRVDIMIKNGLVDEARKFYKDKNLNALNTVGYKELFEYFDNKITLDKAIELIKRNSRHYAKRQLSWFNRDKSIRWFNPSEKEKVIEYINSEII
ncbi:MAG: tRNA (adenosine(37)-N6)-dimethylallyltransferase MiaA [Bacteroidetes bacterium]|nr:MAG: tRNA (adenosine(37)-N6)-dimethylallyltransferase MiaA [Bacteroidota bacterium]